MKLPTVKLPTLTRAARRSIMPVVVFHILYCRGRVITITEMIPGAMGICANRSSKILFGYFRRAGFSASFGPENAK